MSLYVQNGALDINEAWKINWHTGFEYSRLIGSIMKEQQPCLLLPWQNRLRYFLVVIITPKWPNVDKMEEQVGKRERD